MYCTTYLYNGKSERLCEDAWNPPNTTVKHASRQIGSGMPWWDYVLIGFGALCVLVVTGMAFRAYKRGTIPRSISEESKLGLLFAMATFSAVLAVACFIQGFMSNDPHLIHRSFSAGFLNTGGFFTAIGWHEKRSNSVEVDSLDEATRPIKGSRQGLTRLSRRRRFGAR